MRRTRLVLTILIVGALGASVLIKRSSADKNGDAWAVSEFSDSVLRLNLQTGQITEYPMPRFTNMRRAFVDNSTTPVTFWVGNTHGASIVKLEPVN